MEIGNIQLELISKAKKYLERNLNENINVYNSGFCYFCAFGLTPGYARLKLWNEGFKNILFTIKVLFKDIISISKLKNYCITNNVEISEKYNNIIVSWAKKSDFLENGTYFDRYFKISSKDINYSLWFLIYEDEILPEKINNNILIFTKSKKKFKYNFFYLFKYIAKNIISSKFSLKKLFHKISWFTAFSSIVGDSIKNFINNDTRTVIMPYEAQPFQNTIFKTTKKINKKIKTIGYVTSFPCGLPTYYIFRDGSPEELIVNGEDQRYFFVNYLNWNNNQIRVLPSTRFAKKSENMSGYIYLPIALNSTDIIIKSLENFFVKNKEKSISNLIIKNHPYATHSKIHLKIIKQINELKLSYKSFFSNKKDNNRISIFIGATGSIIEALERGVDVIHICDDPIFESYSSVLWPSIKVTKIDNNTFNYQLLKKGNLIKFGEENKLFINSYLN